MQGACKIFFIVFFSFTTFATYFTCHFYLNCNQPSKKPKECQLDFEKFLISSFASTFAAKTFFPPHLIQIRKPLEIVTDYCRWKSFWFFQIKFKKQTCYVWVCKIHHIKTFPHLGCYENWMVLFMVWRSDKILTIMDVWNCTAQLQQGFINWSICPVNLQPKYRRQKTGSG